MKNICLFFFFLKKVTSSKQVRCTNAFKSIKPAHRKTNMVSEVVKGRHDVKTRNMEQHHYQRQQHPLSFCYWPITSWQGTQTVIKSILFLPINYYIWENLISVSLKSTTSNSRFQVFFLLRNTQEATTISSLCRWLKLDQIEFLSNKPMLHEASFHIIS